MKNELSTFSENKPRYVINILITILVLIGLYLSFTAKDGEMLASQPRRADSAGDDGDPWHFRRGGEGLSHVCGQGGGDRGVLQGLRPLRVHAG